MEWILEDRPSVEDYLEYETRLNYVLPKYKDPVICVYNCEKYDAGIVMDILRTHPVVMIGGVMQRNPFFITPDDTSRGTAGTQSRIQVHSRQVLPPKTEGSAEQSLN